jgi:hypothetical protein
MEVIMKSNREELRMAIKIRNITGKKMKTCLFCVRYHRGNYRKALELCSSNPDQEGDRPL